MNISFAWTAPEVRDPDVVGLFSLLFILGVYTSKYTLCGVGGRSREVPAVQEGMAFLPEMSSRLSVVLEGVVIVFYEIISGTEVRVIYSQR